MTKPPKGIPISRRRMLELDGETLCIHEWAVRSGMSDMTLRARLDKGMSLRDAITMPVNLNFRASALRAAARRRGDEPAPDVPTPKKKWHKDRTRVAWAGMLSRCRDPSHKAYPHYKDVEICDRWKYFYNFLADMGEHPEGKTLDRLDNDKGYYKENCRWATPTEQSRNKRNNRLITHNGETKCFVEWAESAGIPHYTLRYRLETGWDFEVAINTPAKKQGSKK